ncbi:575066a2-9553-4fd4-8098-3bb20c4bccac [Sclerotinia trifoliorum]|uniref:575066a2-9553-4fd4-8098-3bb20c4bccac n=1 Tax=Sclerotinia trifoliorum TaxID=28548 RepID=A0A8H2W555_9HELO|nr:575066a2-9553-4fd4-8098-3bb20c4bccac [Sclerotinia trifoliorum]
MDYLQKLVLLFRKRERSVGSSRPVESSRPAESAVSAELAKPAALSFSILKNVPVEILSDIMDFLPLESAVAFSLSCMHLGRLLGTQHFSRISTSAEGTLALLNLLALDLPDQVVCSVCKRLHHMQNLLRYNCITYGTCSTTRAYTSLRFPACVTRDRDNETWIITERFGETAVNMVLKRYHQNPEDRELLKFMSHHKAKITNWGKYLRQWREECRIVQGHLVHRVQSVFISRECSSTADFKPPSTASENICPHIRFQTSLKYIGSGVRRCCKCPTEYRIDFKFFEGLGWARFFTRWKDFGSEGESLWAQHLPSRATSTVKIFRAILDGQVSVQTTAEVPSQLEVQHQEWDLSSAFEDSKDFKFDSLLTAENKAELFRFRKWYWRKVT